MIGHTIGSPVMLQLGSFQFGLSTAAYQDLTRRAGWRWASQDRFGQEPALQSTGPESQAMTLAGVIYAEFRGGTGQLDTLRALGDKQVPQRLIDGNGKLLGRWVIESVEEKQSVFASKGYPRKQEFNLQLKKFPEPTIAGIPVSTAANKVFGQAGAKPPTVVAGDVASVKTGVSKFLEGAASTASKAVASMTSTLAAVQAKAAEIGNAIGPVVATVSRGIAAARTLQGQVASVKQSLGNLSSLGNIQSAMYDVMGAASAASNAGAFAADAAKTLGISLPVTNIGVDPATLQVVSDCRVACGKMAAAATDAYNEADKLRVLAIGTTTP
jgi:phage protein U